MADNIIRRKDKATWGFTADENGQIKLGVPSPADTEDLRSSGSDPKGAHNNGGGENAFPGEDDITLAFLQSLKKDDLLALAAEHGVELDKPKGTKDEVLKELIEYYDVAASE